MIIQIKPQEYGHLLKARYHVQVILVTAPTMKLWLEDVAVEAKVYEPNAEMKYCWCASTPSIKVTLA